MSIAISITGAKDVGPATERNSVKVKNGHTDTHIYIIKVTY